MSTHIKACKKKKQFHINQQNTDADLQQTNSTSRKIKISSHVKQLVTDACVEFAFLDNRPFETQLSGLTGAHVKELLPDPTTINRNIDKTYEFCKKQLVDWCHSIDEFCITVDLWTEGHTGIHFGGVSLHHIDRNNELHVFVVGCYPYDENDQKAPTIRSFVEKILGEYRLKLDDEKYVMSDNENKMKSAFNFQCKRVGCSSHYLNKQLEHAFTSETIDKRPVDCIEIQTLCKHVKSLVAHIRRSHKQLKLTRQLQTYSDTRFNGAFYMLNVFSMVFDELFPIIDNSHKEEYINIDKDFLREICKFLVPFDEVFQELSETNRPTLHRVIPLRQYLLDWCEIHCEDHKGIRKLKTFLKQRIQNSWVLVDEHYLATIVHPKLKDFHTGLPGDKEKAIDLLKTAVQNRVTSSSISLSNVSQSFDQSRANNSMCRKDYKSFGKKNILARCFDQTSNPAPSYLRECDEYLNSTVIIENDDDDLLDYWTKNQHRFPNIHAIARKVLAIPASNTEVERLFSCSKTTMTDRRTRLGPDRLNKLIFLRKNLQSLKTLDEKNVDSRKRKSLDKYDSDNEDEGEQRTPSVSKKHRIEDYDIQPIGKELNE